MFVRVQFNDIQILSKSFQKSIEMKLSYREVYTNKIELSKNILREFLRPKHISVSERFHRQNLDKKPEDLLTGDKKPILTLPPPLTPFRVLDHSDHPMDSHFLIWTAIF